MCTRSSSARSKPRRPSRGDRRTTSRRRSWAGSRWCARWIRWTWCRFRCPMTCGSSWPRRTSGSGPPRRAPCFPRSSRATGWSRRWPTSRRWWRRSRAATWRCSGARSTIRSRNRRARGCFPGSCRRRPPRSWRAHSAAPSPARGRGVSIGWTAMRWQTGSPRPFARRTRGSASPAGGGARASRHGARSRCGGTGRVPEPVFLEPGAETIQRCARCGATWPEHEPSAECRDCGGLLEVVHPHPGVGVDSLVARFAARSWTHPGIEASGVWRYRELVMPRMTGAVSQPEGNTPLLLREAVRAYAGVVELRLKHEGHNPTGSFKDRGMTVALTQAKRIGARAVACASTGNTAASLAAYAAHAGIPALVLGPRGRIALGKLTQALAYGARTLLVDGDFDACLRLAREASRELGVYLVNSINPWRIEGQKTIVLELLQQLGWDAPEWIAFPAGHLRKCAAFGKALREAHALGLIARVPRLAAVQAAGAAPFAASFATGFTSRTRVQAETVASAIRIGDPASWDRAVRAIVETRGVVTPVPHTH